MTIKLDIKATGYLTSIKKLSYKFIASYYTQQFFLSLITLFFNKKNYNKT